MDREDKIRLSSIYNHFYGKRKLGIIISIVCISLSLWSYYLSEDNLKVMVPIVAFNSEGYENQNFNDAYWRFISDFKYMKTFSSSLIKELENKKLKDSFIKNMGAYQHDSNPILNYIFKRMSPFISKYPLASTIEQLPFFFKLEESSSLVGGVVWYIGVNADNYSEAIGTIKAICLALDLSIKDFNKFQREWMDKELEAFHSTEASARSSRGKSSNNSYDTILYEALILRQELEKLSDEFILKINSDYWAEPTYQLSFSDGPYNEFIESQKSHRIGNELARLEFMLNEARSVLKKKNLLTQAEGLMKRYERLLKDKKRADVERVSATIAGRAKFKKSLKVYDRISEIGTSLPLFEADEFFDERLEISVKIISGKLSVYYYLILGIFVALILYTFIVSRSLIRNIYEI